MKKCFALILVLALVLTMAACGGETPSQTTGPNAPAVSTPVADAPTVVAPVQPDPDSWTYNVRGVDVMMHAPAAPVLEALGDYVSYTEQASCAFTGLDKTYFYGGFYLQTYPIGDEDYIYSVWLIDDSSETPEGIYIGAPQSEVEAAYGTTGFNGSNAYIMTGTTSKLTIILDKGVVSSIQYDAVIK